MLSHCSNLYNPLSRSPSDIQLKDQMKAEPFRQSIRDFIQFAETSSIEVHLITAICERFGFQRRRFYDVANVLEAAGVCSKKSVDTLTWIGLKNVPFRLHQLWETARQAGSLNKLSSLFKESNSISISKLTESFLTCFFFSKNKSLDIKKIGLLLSQGSGRYKTTLCKLYQISHILESAGIIIKSANPGEVYISSMFFNIPQPKRPKFPTPIISMSPPPSPNIELLSVESLLNNHETHSQRRIYPLLQ